MKKIVKTNEMNTIDSKQDKKLNKQNLLINRI